MTSPPKRTISPEAAALINTPKDRTISLMPPFTAPLPPDAPEIAAEVQELDALLAPVLTPSEVAFRQAEISARLAAAQRDKSSLAPRTFLNAHLTIIDTLLMDPTITITRLSTETGYSRSWLHKVMSSDAFQAKLAERQKAIVDPIIANSIKDRVQGLASRSLEIIEERMESDEVPLATAMEVFGMASKAMGLGQQKQAPAMVQQFVVHVPPKMTSSADWAAAHSSANTIDAVPHPTHIEESQNAAQ